MWDEKENQHRDKADYMEIPKGILKHIEMNNSLLAKANKHSEIVLEWYEKQIKRLESEKVEIPAEEFSEIKENSLSNGCISIEAIEGNFRLLEK